MKNFIFLTVSFAVCSALGYGVSYAYADECAPIAFTEKQVMREDIPLEIASLLMGYPALKYDEENNQLLLEGKTPYAIDAATELDGADLLDDASLIDQFRYAYPLNFDLLDRQTPWHDPGRVRNSAFFEFLYSSSRHHVEHTLTDLPMPGSKTTFTVTTAHNVACQLKSALAEIGTGHPQLFANVGGSFNWRQISGTDRLSVHSFGAAIDVNAEIGGYWKWSGRKPGKAGTYNNRIPEDVVRTLEKYGFIWGGKWHHFDGMHFEYRPELIIFSNHKSKSN